VISVVFPRAIEQVQELREHMEWGDFGGEAGFLKYEKTGEYYFDPVGTLTQAKIAEEKFAVRHHPRGFEYEEWFGHAPWRRNIRRAHAQSLRGRLKRRSKHPPPPLIPLIPPSPSLTP
jgi:hypothetical protein